MPPLEDYEGNADYLGPFNKGENNNNSSNDGNGEKSNDIPSAPTTNEGNSNKEEGGVELPKE